MPTLLRLSRDARLFEVRYVGALDYARRERAVEETQRRLKDGWVKQLLVDFSEALPVEGADAPGVESFRKALLRSTFPRGMRVAFLDAPESIAEPAMALARALNFRSRRFHDRNHALAWLRGRL